MYCGVKHVVCWVCGIHIKYKEQSKAQTNSLHHDLRVRFPLVPSQPTTFFLLPIVMLPSHLDLTACENLAFKVLLP